MPKGDILERLFGSQARFRLLKLFLLSPSEFFELPTIAERIRMKKPQFIRELNMLEDIGYVRRSTRVITIEQGKLRRLKKKKLNGYLLSRDFPFLNEVGILLASHTPAARERLLSGARGIGKVQLLVIAGKLLGNETEHTDVFIVGDALRKGKLEKVLGQIEADMGKEITYAIMDTREFKYRYGLYDRFIKSLFDSPHELLINKLQIVPEM